MASMPPLEIAAHVQTTTDALTITLFGPMQVRVQGLLLPPFRSRKALWALALLTLRHSRPVEREWLAATLWPDMDQSQAFANLRPVLSELRRALGGQGTRLQSPDRQTLLLELSGAEVDVLAFDTAIKRDSQSRNLPALEQAVALYGGPLLEGCQEEWVPQERASREQKCLQALQTLGEAALIGGNYAAAVSHFQRAASLDLWSDAARRGWMEALAKQGDRNAALQVYREFLNILRSDPTSVPDEQMRALYERLRAEMRQQTSTPPTVKAEMAATPRITGYLPHALTNMVGREDERLEVAERLRRSRLVTLTGMGGIGKTRLAIEVGSECIQEYPDGVWLVALEALSDGKMVAQQIAFVLGLKEESGQSLLQSLKETLRGKRLLLVLDNCEHLLEASAQAAAYLLRECAEVHILATSRESLGITGETAWAVPSLAAPDPAHLPQAGATLSRVLTGYESVQLFVDRAQAVQKTFALTKSNAQAVAQICFRLEGIPLALELAAARIKALTAKQIAARLDNELGLLTGGSRTAQSRQRTLRSTLDWSYALLNEPERLLLRRLSVFAGGWTLEAAEQVCRGEGIDTSQVLELLTMLVQKSLVTFEDRMREGGGRYRMLEIVRQYAAEKLEVIGGDALCRDRHLAWFLAMVEEAEPHLRGSKQESWLQRIDMEYDNLRATLVWSEVGTREVEYGLRLRGALWWFWRIKGNFSEGRQYLEAALGQEGARGETAFRTKALMGAGVFATFQGDYVPAHAFLEESLFLNQKLGNREGVASSLGNLAYLATCRNDLTTAFSLHQESLDISREIDNKRAIAASLGNLGNNLRQQGDYASAQTMLAESLKIRREIEDEFGTGLVLASLGNLASQKGDYISAQAYLEESLEFRRRLKDRSGIAATLSYLGCVADARGDYTMAQALFEESLEIRRELGEKRLIAWSLNQMGNFALHKGHLMEACELLNESLAISRGLANKEAIAVSLNYLGNTTFQLGEYRLAHKYHAESMSKFGELGDREGIADTLHGLASVLAAQAEWEQAMHLWGAAEALRESIGFALSPVEQEIHRRQVEKFRLSLGEEAFASTWAEGRAMTWEQAVAIALSERGSEPFDGEAE